MKLHYLGTAAAEGCPALFCKCELCKAARLHGGKDVRTRSQVLVDDSLLVDFPPDTYHHMLTSPEFDLPAIRHLLITHSHADHFYQQDIALRSKDFAGGLEGKLMVYGNDRVVDNWNDMLSGEYSAFKDIPDWVSFNYLSPFTPVMAGDHKITAIPANHKPDEHCYLYHIEKDGTSLLYANDTGISLGDDTWDYLSKQHFDCVSMDCTAMDRRVGQRHMGLPDNLELKTKLMDMGAATHKTVFIVTHFSHFGALTHTELSRRAAVYGFETAYDGMKILIKGE